MEDYTVLAPDKSRPRKFLYHADKKPMIVYEGKENKWYAEGWQDTPAAFFPMEKHGVPEEKKAELHQEIKEDAMDTKKLKAYADKHLPGLQYYKTASKKTMLRLIKAAKHDIEVEEEKFLSDEEFH
jgi:hypothetical protein